MEIIKYHMIALAMGFLLDLIIGDPYNLPHPIRLIGSYISFLDEKLYKPSAEDTSANNKRQIRRGLALVLIVVLSVIVVTSIILISAYLVNIILGIVVEAILTCYILATKSLKVESMKVYEPLKADDIEGARKAVSMIVGRDTDILDKEGVTKACVETVAENTSDGVIAPLLYTFLGGPILGMTYKAINTMDSMIGYHNDRYEYFGRVAAKCDDIVNFLPARISAYLMILAALILKYDYKKGYDIYKRDRFNHKSPNSAHTESVAAGVLRIRLAGDAMYFGKLVKKPFIGDAVREIEEEDIVKVNKLLYATAIIAFIICEIILYVFFVLF